MPEQGPAPKEAIQALADLFAALFTANGFLPFLRIQPGCDWIADDLLLMHYNKRRLCAAAAYCLWEWRLIRPRLFDSLCLEFPGRIDAIRSVEGRFTRP
jgi:hypothetical protein